MGVGVAGYRATSVSNRLANALLCVGAFVSSWNAVSLNGVNIPDIVLPAAFLLMLIAWALARRPVFVHAFMLLPALATVVVAAWDVAVDPRATGDFEMILRVLITTAGVAIALTSAAASSGTPILVRVLRWYVCGAAVSASVAILVNLGLLSIPAGLLDQPFAARANGLGNHPNSLAFSITMAIPVAVYLAFLVRGFWRRGLWLVVVVVLTWGLLLSESRGGFLVGIPALVVAVVCCTWRSRLRLLLLPIVLVSLAAAFIYFPTVINNTRLVEGRGDGSDAIRSIRNTTAMDIFASSPLIGQGFNAQIGVAVPLTVITAGGIILALGYYAFVLRPLPVLLSARKTVSAQIGLLSLASFIAFGFSNPVFMDRATYWPILIPTLLVLAARGGDYHSDPWATASQSHARGRQRIPPLSRTPPESGHARPNMETEQHPSPPRRDR